MLEFPIITAAVASGLMVTVGWTLRRTVGWSVLVALLLMVVALGPAVEYHGHLTRGLRVALVTAGTDLESGMGRLVRMNWAVLLGAFLIGVGALRFTRVGLALVPGAAFIGTWHLSLPLSSELGGDLSVPVAGVSTAWFWILSVAVTAGLTAYAWSPTPGKN